MGQKAGGWVQSWVGGSCPKYPPPSSYKRSLTCRRAKLIFVVAHPPPPPQALREPDTVKCSDWIEGDKGCESGTAGALADFLHLLAAQACGRPLFLAFVLSPSPPRQNF